MVISFERTELRKDVRAIKKLAAQREAAQGGTGAAKFAREYEERANDLLDNGFGLLGNKLDRLRIKANFKGFGHPQRQVRNLKEAGINSSDGIRALEQFA